MPPSPHERINALEARVSQLEAKLGVGAEPKEEGPAQPGFTSPPSTAEAQSDKGDVKPQAPGGKDSQEPKSQDKARASKAGK
jgi:hypothetical protein